MAGRRRTFSAVFLDAARLFDQKTHDLVLHLDECDTIAESGRTVERINEIYVANTVVNAVMYLEANANEFFRQALEERDHAEYNDTPKSIFSKDFYWRLDTYEHDFMEQPWKRQYKLLLRFAGKEPFDEDSDPFDSAALLNRLRNYLVHFESEYYDASPDLEPHKLARDLAEKGIGRNPWHTSGDVVYPQHALGPDCTRWAVDSAESFTREFHSRVGHDRRYELMHDMENGDVSLEW